MYQFINNMSKWNHTTENLFVRLLMTWGFIFCSSVISQLCI